jgi:uncharacterized damage-inducible protein DinB
MLGYINEAEGDDLIKSLEDNLRDSLAMYNSFDETFGNYRYAEGKWSIKEVIAHITDTERIFAYRALTIARKDNTPLPGFDENAYAVHSNAGNRTLSDIIKEYELVRLSNILMIKGLAADALDTRSLANNREVTPRILCWMMAGHNTHHNKVFKERYLVTV